MHLINSNLIKIAELLNDGQYHDGNAIGAKLHITRAAVWKIIKKLKTYHIPLESVKGKGYRLESPIILLDHKKITPHLKQRSIKLSVFEKIASTNDYLKDMTFPSKAMTICLAETQTHGKGRLKRQWHSPFGQNIYFSMRYPFEKDISELSGLSLVLALAICHSIGSFVDTNTTPLFVKWPNDIIIGQAKLAGTLIEVQAESNGFCEAMIGIGINVNMSKATKKEIQQPWTSLLKITEQHVDRNQLCITLINALIDYLQRFSSNGLNDFLDEYKEHDLLTDKPIAVTSRGKKHTGNYVGINHQGHLLLKTNSNTIQAYSSGDTSILK